MPLGIEVGLAQATVFDGDPATSKGGFGPCLLWPNGWMDEDATWYGSRPWPRAHCIRRGPSSPRKGRSSPLFSAHVCCGHGRPSQLLLSSCITVVCRYRVSVCLSQVGVLLKRVNDSPCRESTFLVPKISAKLKRGHPQRRRQTQVGRLKLPTFDK